MDLTWTKTAMICCILLSAGFAAYLGANVTVNVNDLVDVALKNYLEQTLNSSFYLLQKPCSYLVSMVGSYACMQNGTTGKLDSYSTNTSKVFDNVKGNLTNGGIIHLKEDTIYVLSSEITFDSNADLEKEWILEGEGQSTILSQSTSGKSAIVITNRTRVQIRNLRIYVGSSALYGIYAKKDATTGSSMERCKFENIVIQGGGSSSILMNLENPMKSDFDMIRLETSASGTRCLKLDFTTYSGPFGNLNFGYLYCAATNTGVPIIDMTAPEQLANLMTFQHIEVWGSTTHTNMIGINLNGKFGLNTFQFVAIEDVAIGIQLAGFSSDDLCRHNWFYGGFIGQQTDIGISCETYTSNNVFENFVMSTTSYCIQDTSTSTAPNVYRNIACSPSATFSMNIDANSLAKFEGYAGWQKFFENSGTATISSSTTVTFNHLLVGTPTHVWASFNSTAVDGWKWTATSTQITVTVTPSGTYTVYWMAEYKP